MNKPQKISFEFYEPDGRPFDLTQSRYHGYSRHFWRAMKIAQGRMRRLSIKKTVVNVMWGVRVVAKVLPDESRRRKMALREPPGNTPQFSYYEDKVAIGRRDLVDALGESEVVEMEDGCVNNPSGEVDCQCYGSQITYSVRRSLRQKIVPVTKRWKDAWLVFLQNEDGTELERGGYEIEFDTLASAQDYIACQGYDEYVLIEEE